MQLYSNKLTFDVIIFTQLVVLRNTCMVFVLIQLASCNANFSMLVGFCYLGNTLHISLPRLQH